MLHNGLQFLRTALMLSQNRRIQREPKHSRFPGRFKMMNTILTVDKDAVAYEREVAEWVNYGIDALRVDTMTEAINLLTHGSDFLFVIINEDTVPDFMSKLRIMRDAANLPIFVITTNYTIEKKLKAMDCGADVYERSDAYIKNNVIGALELLKSKNKWTKRQPKSLRVLTGGDIILSPLRRNVFIKDNKVSLTRKEFDILQCLMSNNGYVVTHARLMRKVWGDKRKLRNTDVLWRTINRLRGKLYEIAPANKYIEIERGVGYKFSLIKEDDE